RLILTQVVVVEVEDASWIVGHRLNRCANPGEELGLSHLQRRPGAGIEPGLIGIGGNGRAVLAGRASVADPARAPRPREITGADLPAIAGRASLGAGARVGTMRIAGHVRGA